MNHSPAGLNGFGINKSILYKGLTDQIEKRTAGKPTVIKIQVRMRVGRPLVRSQIEGIHFDGQKIFRMRIQIIRDLQANGITVLDQRRHSAVDPDFPAGIQRFDGQISSCQTVDLDGFSEKQILPFISFRSHNMGKIRHRPTAIVIPLSLPADGGGFHIETLINESYWIKGLRRLGGSMITDAVQLVDFNVPPCFYMKTVDEHGRFMGRHIVCDSFAVDQDRIMRLAAVAGQIRLDPDLLPDIRLATAPLRF
ncbi:MAG: hypothetical protein BWY83_02004 [bacterium ADurb.Bin478]|nr:MAG: hypothetical protein BWY83_02004 [bacterium ADurb.Bin478]